MLPSKGYFSGIPCPFYDSSICERPHCHFRHSKKDKTNNAGEEVTKSEKDKNVNIIKELVTETVKHVLSHTEIREKTETTHLNTDAIVTDVVKTIQPSIENSIDTNQKDFSNSSEIPSYKPTPISELNKKHIPVIYAPTRPVYLDRFKKKEIKESVFYTPKSLNENSPPSTTYIPSSSKARYEAYSPENISSYRYIPNSVTKKKLAEGNEELGVSQDSNENNTLDKYDDDLDNKGKLEALDRLIEDEFSQPVLLSLSNDDVGKEDKLNVDDTENISNENTSKLKHSSNSGEGGLSGKIKSSEEAKLSHKSKGHRESSSKHSSSHDKHNHSRSKSNEKHSHSKSSSHSNHSSSKSKSDEKHGHTKTSHSSDSSKHKTSHSSSKSHSDKPSKPSTNSEKNSHKKSKSDNPSKSSSNHDKGKLKSTNKKSLKEISKSSHNKGRSSSSTSKDKKHSKSSTTSRSTVDKKKKEKDDKKKSHKKKELSPDELAKNETSRKTPDPVISNEYLKSESLSSTSDLEEVTCSQEPILIDSSSNSSVFEPAEMSYDSHSPTINSDNESEIEEINVHSSPSESEQGDSPPPAKRPRDDEESSKASVSGFPSSLFSDRWKKARETVKKSSASGKIRIAHVPNVTSLLCAKDKLIAKTKTKPPPKDDLTLPKKPEDFSDDPAGLKRMRKAHAPSQERLKYPHLLMEENLKVPVSIRQTCLNNLYDEFVKYCEEEEARSKAQTEEIEICRRLHVPKTYQNAVALTLLKIRKMKGNIGGELDISNSNVFSSNSVPDYTYGWTVYKCFSEYLMKEEEFVSHGFPIEIKSKPGCAYIEKTARRYDVKQPEDPSLRICANCSNNYYVDDKGFPIKEYDCFYHWGRLARTRVRGGITEFYRCCNGEVGSEPCTTGRYHVCNSYDEDCLEGFVETRHYDEEPDKAGIFAMDCEMCYTTKGLDLTRCTVVDINGKMVYDEVITPESPILDYNTRFSGITEEMILKSRKKLRHVQRDLLKFVNEKSILVGHSLENDFKALRLIHKTVVDTSIVFPHHLGLPYKKALKLIAKDLLKINIQENESGHDSYEDANTCMQIMMAKIKEDAKKRKPRVIISLDSKSKGKLNNVRVVSFCGESSVSLQEYEV